ncbi:RimJ/RimL family protein N-acetyltransferase [Tumebacillus algifaecis]|uniref:RimJ/RimL family protein N-acetyltransferase n=1 Tax=Tumebacillus algifaecis TaxID=1214604 RepID=A0A223CY47_9BACL|nr:GNAT family protein [Tumebacillus algifaecis]ASS74320.1 RimJ/RimL family protein N-acetyltransferase [Tumebacillus algifaecis]
MIDIKLLELENAHALLEVLLRNREFFKLIEPTQDEEYYTLEGQLKVFEHSFARRELDQYYWFGIFLKESGELIGTVSLMQVMRGPHQKCLIGYFLDQSQNGKGYMSEAVRLAVDYAFQTLRLHRIEAGVMPHNIGSIRVLEKAGFHTEGIAKKNVKINGKWEDHQLMAILNPNES